MLENTDMLMTSETLSTSIILRMKISRARPCLVIRKKMKKAITGRIIPEMIPVRTLLYRCLNHMSEF